MNRNVKNCPSPLKNSRGKLIIVYDTNNNERVICEGNFKKMMKKLELPYSVLKKSYQNNVCIYERCRNVPKKYLKYKGWYAKDYGYLTYNIPEVEGRIFVSGDWHGNPTPISSENWPESTELSQSDIVLQLGDFGLYWDNPPSKEEIYWLEWLKTKPFQIAFLGGNHESYTLLESHPYAERFGGLVRIDKSETGEIIELLRGEVYTMSNKKILTIGGALSIDKAYRSEGFSWWPQEYLSYKEENNTFDNLDKHNWKVDYVLTHTCPYDIIEWFLDNPSGRKFDDKVSKFLLEIDNRLEFNEWHFGHFHNDRVYERQYDDGKIDKYYCHYTKIQELKDNNE